MREQGGLCLPLQDYLSSHIQMTLYLGSIKEKALFFSIEGAMLKLQRSHGGLGSLTFGTSPSNEW